MARFIDRTTGMVKLSPKQGDRAKPKPSRKEKDTGEIQICLSCKKAVCKGNCKRIEVARNDRGKSKAD